MPILVDTIENPCYVIVKFYILKGIHMVTIKEIAALAGVSRGTVDRVLNNRGSVNEDTAKKVCDIAKTVDYKPNKAGLALAAQKKKLKIGVILFGENNPFFDEVLEGVRSKSLELSAYDCTTIIRQVPFDIDTQLAAIDELVHCGIHGLALTPYNAPEIINKINVLADLGIPVVTVNTDVDGSRRIAYVGSDYYQCGRTAGGLMGLFTGGKAKLGIITGSSRILCHTQRIAGFMEIIKDFYPDIELIATVENHDDEFQSYEKTHQLLEMHPEITALFFSAAGVNGGCQAAIQVEKSQHILIVSFDVVPTTRQMLLQGVISATISQHPFKQGSKPLELLFDYLTTGILPENEINYVEAAIKIRENI